MQLRRWGRHRTQQIISAPSITRVARNGPPNCAGSPTSLACQGERARRPGGGLD
ncbi:hypothetical protein [Kibdelosporangium philippinense]|uniref:hypothetical protein n=1 Tax=Kibdelosporangium philippinense TaxID=211113 RepID=UPI00360C56AB